MLRTNLATRPFYNERAAHAAIALAAMIVLAITVFNIVRIVSLSRHNTELSSRTGVDDAEAARLTAEAARIRRTVDKDELELVVAAAAEANALIDQRTFSWTEFFNQIESTLPPDVMLTSVRPSVVDGATNVTMGVLGRRAEDVDEFMEKLDETGAFEHIRPAAGDRTEEGLHRVVVESTYTGTVDDAPTEAAPAAAPARAKPPESRGRR
jgi:hypothetical protein